MRHSGTVESVRSSRPEPVGFGREAVSPHTHGRPDGRFLRGEIAISPAAGVRLRDPAGRPVQCRAMAPATFHAEPLCAPDVAEPSTRPCGFVGPGDPLDAAPEARTPVDAPAGDSLAVRAEIVERLHKSFYHRVFCFARRRANDEVAEEVAHESFVRLLRVRNLETMTVSVAYLLRIAENLLKRRHERARRYRSVLEHSGIVSGVSCGGASVEGHGGGLSHGHAAQVDGWVDAGRLDAVLAQLTREEQAAVRLIVCEGLDYQSAARSLGVPVSTINNWKHRGLAKLKQLVGEPAALATNDGPRAVG